MTAQETAPAAHPGRRRTICNVLIAVAAVHFVVFVGTIVALGGDALTGRADGGRYFLGNHGQLLEVGRGAWILSAVIGWTLVYGTFPLGVVAALLRPRKKGNDRPRFWWKG